MWNLVSVHLEVVLFSAQDRGTVCDDCTSGTEIILGTPDEEARFDPFGDSVNLGARKVLGFAPNVPCAWNCFGHTRMVLLGNGNLFSSVWR